MKAKIHIIGQQAVFTHEDMISAEVVVKRFQGDPYFSALVTCVTLNLICEGKFASKGKHGMSKDEKPKVVRYFESQPVVCRCNYTTRGHVTYSGELQFPSNDTEYPSSVLYDVDAGLGIKWFMKATIYRDDGDEPYIVEQPVTYQRTSPLPNCLDLVDVEHSETLDGSNITLVTTHSTVGLPQIPLTAGLSFNVICQTPKKFMLTRVRVLLCEINELFSQEGTAYTLPIRRWLLHDVRCRNGGIKLESLSTNLGQWVGDIHLDHATLAPSFQTEHFKHSFDLVAEITVTWNISSGSSITKKLSSVSPVNVLPRISSKTWMTSFFSPFSYSSTPSGSSTSKFEAHAPTHAHQLDLDLAEITDTSNEDSDNNMEKSDYYGLEPGASSSASSDSVNSVFSSHMKLEEERLSTIPSITTTLY